MGLAIIFSKLLIFCKFPKVLFFVRNMDKVDLAKQLLILFFSLNNKNGAFDLAGG